MCGGPILDQPQGKPQKGTLIEALVGRARADHKRVEKRLRKFRKLGKITGQATAHGTHRTGRRIKGLAARYATRCDFDPESRNVACERAAVIPTINYTRPGGCFFVGQIRGIKLPLKGRVSTVVVQRFCKPKVGGSNPSPGTIPPHE